MSGVSGKNVPAVRIFRGFICHAACENHGFYGGLVILFPAFSGVFPVFGFRAKKFRAGFFRVSAVFLYRSGMYLCLSLTHAHMCAYVRPREIHNVELFPFLFVDLKKYPSAMFLFTDVYKKSAKFPQKIVV